MVAWTVAVLMTCGAAWAQKNGEPSPPSGELFFTMKGQPFALERTFPGVNAVLLLTPEQAQKLSAAADETIHSENVRKAGAEIKGNPQATDAQKEAAQKIRQEAREKLEHHIAGILTLEQKALVERINAAAKETHETVAESLKTQFAEAKGDEDRMKQYQETFRQKVAEVFGQRLNAFLTPDQKAAMDKAAERQKADAAAPKTKKTS